MHRLITIAALFPTLAHAETPRVVTDIAPVHSLVAQVMGDLGTPQNLIDPTLSPHDFNLKPSQARALQDAGLLIMVGHELTPWLADRASELMAEGQILSLLESSPMLIEPGEDHEGHDHGDDHSDHSEDEEHAEHGHEGHTDDDHAEHGQDDDHAEHDHDEKHAEDSHEGHDHAIDPHAWLNLENAGAWVGQIASALAERDPENAAIYQANAAEAQSKLQDLDRRANDVIEPVRSGTFLVYHDAYRYFTRHYGLLSNGALSSNEGVAPSAADVKRAREAIEHDGVRCIFTELQFGDAIVATVSDGLDVTVEVLDPLGAQLVTGPDLYTQLIENMAGAFSRCLKP